MIIPIAQEVVFTGAYGTTRTGKTVVATVLDSDGNVKATGFTIASVVELGYGYYSVKITFTEAFAGLVKFDNTTDGLVVFNTFSVQGNTVELNVAAILKVLTNRWKITGTQLVQYDDDGVTAIYTYNLFKNSVPDGETPDERVRV